MFSEKNIVGSVNIGTYVEREGKENSLEGKRSHGSEAEIQKSNRENVNRVGVISFRGESAMRKEARGTGGEEGGKGRWEEVKGR